MTSKLSPSMMCAGIERITGVLDTFKAEKIEYLHIDIMDGVFVPNYTLGTDYVKQLCRLSNIPLDIHLMIERPEDKVSWFDPQPSEYVSIHYKSTAHVHRTLGKVKTAGVRPMIALNPATHYMAIEHILDYIDAVLVMTVNPGYAGQTLIDSTLTKISSLRQWLDKSGHSEIEIEVDGNDSFISAKRMREAGANLFVAGSSSVFTPELPLADAIARLRDVVK